MRSFREIKEDIEYLRAWEDVITALLAGNIGYSLFRKFVEGKSEVQEKVRSVTLEYLSKISGLRKEYEKEMEELLKLGKYEEEQEK